MSDEARDIARKFLAQAAESTDPTRKVLLLELADVWLNVATIVEGRQVTAGEVMGATERPANTDGLDPSD